jgi:hypothetical protein
MRFTYRLLTFDSVYVRTLPACPAHDGDLIADALVLRPLGEMILEVLALSPAGRNPQEQLYVLYL